MPRRPKRRALLQQRSTTWAAASSSCPHYGVGNDQKMTRVSGATSHASASQVPYGATYAVCVIAQPTGLSQTRNRRTDRFRRVRVGRLLDEPLRHRRPRHVPDRIGAGAEARRRQRPSCQWQRLHVSETAAFNIAAKRLPALGCLSVERRRADGVSGPRCRGWSRMAAAARHSAESAARRCAKSRRVVPGIIMSRHEPALGAASGPP